MRRDINNMPVIWGLTLFIVLSALGTAQAQIKLDGYFIARKTCPALSAIRKNSNPGNLQTISNYAYNLKGKNKEHATHYLIEIGNPPQMRWVDLSCGEHVVPVKDNTHDADNRPPPDPGKKSLVLAVSWQPAFCETRPGKPECTSQNANRFDATHFSLHGLWPQPRDKIYCGVPAHMVALDKDQRWGDLPPLLLSNPLRQELERIMPGTQSNLQRHEWLKHGTCYSQSEQQYYEDSVRLMKDLNRSEVRDLFASHIGKTLKTEHIQRSFEKAFGNGAGNKIKVSCIKDGKRRLIKEITIGLSGDLGNLTMRDALALAEPANNAGCDQGIVDPAGFQ